MNIQIIESHINKSSYGNKLPFSCRGICLQYPNVFHNMYIGTAYYRDFVYCSTCEKFVSVTHYILKLSNRCPCCSAPFRKSRRKKTPRKKYRY